jgi:sugar phosphate isomerase/epimerase
MLEILAIDPRLRMTLDSNHMLQESLTDFTAPLAGMIVTTHLSDYDGVDERHWLPGRGICDFRGLFALLEAARYTGVYNMELAAPYTPRAAMDALRQFC